MDQLVDSLQQKLGISPKTVPHAAVHDYDAHVRTPCYYIWFLYYFFMVMNIMLIIS